MKELSRMRITAATTVIPWVLVFGPDGKVLFCAINYPGSWSDGTLTTRFFSHIKERIGDYRFVSIKVFHEAVMPLVFLLVQFQRGVHADCTHW